MKSALNTDLATELLSIESSAPYPVEASPRLIALAEKIRQQYAQG